MSELIYPNKALPEVDWENPLTDGLVALFYFDGTNVVEVISGKIGTGAVVSEEDGWTGQSQFNIADLDCKFLGNDETCTAVFSRIHWDSAASNTAPLVQLNKDGKYLNFVADYSYGATNSAALRGGYNSSQSTFSSPDETRDQLIAFNSTIRSTTQAWEYNTIYQGGELSGVLDNAGLRSGSEIISTIDVGSTTEDVVKVVAVYTQRKTEQDLQELEANPYQLFKTEETVEQEYGLASGTGNNAGSIEITGLVGAMYIEITYDSIDSGGFYLLDGRRIAGVADSSLGNKYFLSNGNTFGVTNITVNGVESADIVADFVKGSTIAFNLEAAPTLMFNSKWDYSYANHGSVTKTIKIIDDNGLHYFSFNQTRGDYVASHTSDLIATLYNFPDDSGYVRAWGVGDGLEYTTTIQAVTAPNIVSVTNNLEIEIELGAPIPVAVGNYLHLLQHDEGGGFLFKFDNNQQWAIGGTLLPSVFVNGVEVTGLSNESSTAQPLLDDAVSGDIIKLVSSIPTTGSGALTLGNSLALTRGASGLVIRSVRTADDNGSRYYDFTKIIGNSTVVPETVNGQDGTMVGFPTNGVFVPEKNKTLVGQLLEGNAKNVEIPVWEGVGEFTVKGVITKTTNTSEYRSYILGDSLSAFNLAINQDSLQFRIYSNSTATINVDGYLGDIEFTIVRDANNLITMTALGQTSTLSAGDNYVLSKIGRGSGNIEGFYGAFKLLELLNISSVDDRRYDFSIEAGNTIMDTSGNNNHGTVVGGELQRIYDYSGYGEIVGYNVPDDTYWKIKVTDLPTLDTLTVKIYMLGSLARTNYNVLINSATNDNIIYKSNTSGNLRTLAGVTNTRINGEVSADLFHAVGGDLISFDIASPEDFYLFNSRWSGDSESFAGVFSKVEIWKGSLLLRNYDLTTGDQSKIIETIQGKHAIISNDSVVKWQPLLERFIFNKSDYADADLFATAQKTGTGIQEYQFSDVQQLTSTIRIDSMTADKMVFRGVGEAWDGNLNKVGVAKLTRSVLPNPVLDTRVKGIEYHNLIVDAGGEETDHYGATGEVKFNNVGIFGSWYSPSGTSKVTFKNSKIITLDAAFPCVYSYGEVSLLNSLVEHIVGHETYGAVRVRSAAGKLTIQNTLVDNKTYTPSLAPSQDGSVITGSNNIFALASGDDLFVGDADANYNTYFTSDGQLTESGQTATKGKGWNGSDLVAWAYASIDSAPVIDITIDFDSIASTSTLSLYNAVTSTSVSPDSIASTSTLSAFNAITSTVINPASILSSSTFDDFNLDTSTVINPESVSSSSTLDNFGYTVTVNCAFDTISSSSSLSFFEMDAGVSPLVVFDSIYSLSGIGSADITTATALGLSPIVSTSTLTNIVFNVETTISFSQVGSASNADQFPLTITTTLNCDPIQSSTLLGRFDVTTQTAITLNSISSTSELDHFILSGSLGYFELSAVAFEFVPESLCCVDYSEESYQALVSNTDIHTL
jgi:hypothetical protein